MFPTDEVRWFFKGEIPPPVTAWFEAQVCTLPAQPPRIDYYLRLRDDDSLGIKLREGRIEVKQREGAGELIHLGEQAAGWVESWRKWSFSLAEAETAVTETAHWLGVWKRRRWCLFDVRENGRIIPTPTTAILEQGCACELTEIRLADSADWWWSLGFEAFGETDGRRERLLRVAQQFLEPANAPVLAVDNSYSYPAWLQMVGGNGRIYDYGCV